MNVAINTLFLQPGRGRGTLTYVRHCAKYLAQVPNVKVHLLVYGGNGDLFHDLPHTTLVRCAAAGSNRLLRILYEQLLLERRAHSIAADVLFCPGYLAPVTRSVPTVVTIHDTQYLDIPDGLSFAFRWTYRALLPRGARSAARVLTVSEYSRQQILRHLALAPEKVVTVHEGAFDDGWNGPSDREQAETLERFNLRRGFLLSASSSAIHKNIPRLIGAYQQLPKRLRETYPLVFVGQHSNWYPLSEAILKSSGVRFLGYVSDADLRNLYVLAGAFVLASYYEGFGLPVLEAMQGGAPVACASTGSLPEIGGDAALFFDPLNEADIAAKLTQLLENPVLQDELRKRGKRNVARFSWKRCAVQTAAVLRLAAEKPSQS